jgi:small-conductance mechanosensitive channel
LSSGLVTFFFWTFETIAARHRFRHWEKYLDRLRLKRVNPQDEEKAVDKDEKREQEQKAAKPTPLLWEVALAMPVVVIYALARGYMVVEVFMSLRILPLGAYNTVDAGKLIPRW